MDLLCSENERECRAYADQVILKDDRVLEGLLRTEERYTPSTSYFRTVQKEITSEMRDIVADWMLEVCVEQTQQEEVFLLATNYLDRFLSVCSVPKTCLQLLGTACLLLASKLRQSQNTLLSADMLVQYTDNSITHDQLLDFEWLVLTKLKWELSAVTAHDFLPHLLERLPLVACDLHAVRRHAHTYIALCARDYKFCRYLPSMIAASSIAAALNGLGWTTKSGFSLSQLLDSLQAITSTERDYLQVCLDQIEGMLSAVAPVSDAAGACGVTTSGSNPATSNRPSADHATASSSSPSADKMHEAGKAGTPTDVWDIHF
ncbi:G1/S-specific cyclin-D2-like [Schistocerca americana]|uniref:G1/S-specific cyclin-D2-like n=1 Tax=Schistocerca americana TaxID=7009 RepID=UPI001F4FC72D|nr:G1/S-specific cyclin-D2-like [Schistocerca americana]